MDKENWDPGRYQGHSYEDIRDSSIIGGISLLIGAIVVVLGFFGVWG